MLSNDTLLDPFPPTFEIDAISRTPSGVSRSKNETFKLFSFKTFRSTQILQSLQILTEFLSYSPSYGLKSGEKWVKIAKSAEK